ncbi:MAG: hypothetical protein DME82_10555 [Verrucomicrobia bacterium]|nr:MAG: hypothetical protein DME82_10555 [Verrucomicrobiota bacterium]
MRSRKNFTGVCEDLVMNCSMIRRALAVAVGFIVVCFPVTAQQANRSATAKARTGTHQQLPANRSHPGSELSLYQPTIFSTNDNSLLFRKGRVLTWSDGGRLASENALVSTGMIALDLFSSGYLPPLNAFGPVSMNRGTTAPNSRPGNLGTDPKDSPELMTSPPDRFYYGGEIGFMYGHWSGKGGGDMMESYIMGAVGNDHFQITAGAAFEDWNGHAARFHSFVPR